MTTRRSFLKHAAAGGMVFCSCGLLDAARAQGAAPRTLPVSVNGKRVKTIDVHAHCLFHEAVALMGDQSRNLRPQTKGSDQMFIAVEERLKQMDAMAIDMEVLSINPFWYRKDRDTAAQIVKINNEKLAELCASKPDRFAAFASLALQFPDLAVAQLETAVKKQGLRGAAIGGSVLGENFADPKFHPVWAKAEELGAALFIHPQSTPELAARFKGNGWLSNTIGNPLETTLALQHLIFEGTLDRFPGLKVIAAHGGGYLPSYAPRSDHAISPPRSAPASSCSAPITRFRGRSTRSTTSSPPRRSATTRRSRSSAATRPGCSGWARSAGSATPVPGVASGTGKETPQAGERTPTTTRLPIRNVRPQDTSGLNRSRSANAA
jgi:aminocarboxymuconate-semialdehyde decarboxylase